MTIIFLTALLLIVLSTLIIVMLRKVTKISLERYSNLPTVLWKPRFTNYVHGKMMNVGSSITNILPKMERIGEKKYGMFGTVYGISTKVVHIAHPVPARLVLGAESLSSSSSIIGASVMGDDEKGLQLGALKRPSYNHFFNFSGQGVFTSDGKDWRMKRASVLHALFRGSQGSSFSNRIENEANNAATNFITEIKAKFKHRRKRPLSEFNEKDFISEVDVVPLLQRSTIGLIFRYITRDDTFWTKDFSADIIENNGIKIPKGLAKYLDSVTRIRMIILAQARSIWFLFPRWVYVKFSRMFQQEEETMISIRNFAALACSRARPGSPLDVLRNRSSHNGGSPSNLGFITQDLLDEAITLLFAGQDTSAATLSWTLHLLSLYPESQQKLYDEISALSQNENDEEKKGDIITNNYIDRKTISSLRYLDAVIKESMRLYPVAPFVVRCLPHDVPIPESNIVLSKGSFACVWIYGLHRNAKLWSNPHDFIPERWLDDTLKRQDIGQSMGAYMPFAAGPRGCLGQSIGNVVLRVILARIITEFKISDPRVNLKCSTTSLRKDMQAGFTVLPTDGLQLLLQERKPS